MAQYRSATWIASVTLVLGGAWWWFMASGGTDRTLEAQPHFVGDQSCRECHEDIYDRYQRSSMHRTWQPLSSENTIEDFAASNHVYDSKRDLHYELTSRDGQYLQREYRTDEDGVVTHELERAISFVIGSGEHARGYVSESDGYLNEMPIWWFPEKSNWDLSPSSRVFNFRFERPLTAGCVSCHTDSRRLVEGTFNLYASTGSHGIGCERCHGPAEWHVRQERDGWSPPGGPGNEMFLNPARLAVNRQGDVCFQCHLLGDAQFPFPDQDQFGYRPGLRLANYRCDYVAHSSDPDAFGIVSHASRMVQSKCYKESKGELNCLTCHDPHASSREVPPETHRQKCLNCHTQDSCSRVPDATVADRQNECITCHMSRGEPTYVEHTVYTDHWIRRPSGGTKSREPSSELVVLQDFWNDPRMKEEREGIAHVAYAIFSGNQANMDRGLGILANAAMRDDLHRDGWRRLGMGAMLRGDVRLAATAFGRGVQTYPKDAALHMGLGSALHSMGDRKRALAELEEAIRLAPGMLEPYVETAAIYAEQDQPRKAQEILEVTLSRYPHQAAAWSMLGTLLCQSLGDVPRGIDALRRATQLDPDDLSVRVALASALMGQNELNAASDQLRPVLRIAPHDTTALLVMARLHILRQERMEAIGCLERVLRLDPKNSQARELLRELGELPGNDL